jgi:F0F1-type ATP synthase delta subunit
MTNVTRHHRAVAEAVYAALAGVPAADLAARAKEIAGWMQKRGLLPLAAKVLAAIPDAERRALGRERVTVRSAGPLDAAMLERLVAAAGADASKADVEHVTDETLLSGATVRRASSVLDVSLKGKLAELM